MALAAAGMLGGAAWTACGAAEPSGSRRAFPVKETVGIVERVERERIWLLVPQGNLTTTPVYDPARVAEMSTRVRVEALLGPDTRVGPGVKPGTTVFLVAQEDLALQRTVQAVEVSLLNPTAPPDPTLDREPEGAADRSAPSGVRVKGSGQSAAKAGGN